MHSLAFTPLRPAQSENLNGVCKSQGSCPRGSCEEEINGNTIPEMEILTSNGTFLLAISRTGILNNCHMSSSLNS